MTDFPTVENAEPYLGIVEEGANDLDVLSEKLLQQVEAMQSVATMSEPVRSDAIAIARDILNKLKLKFGDRNIHEGLDIQSAEDVSILSAIAILGELFEHLLAWGRGIDASIMNDPSVQGTINAIGQIAFMAKMEGLKLAKKSRDMFLLDSIRQRIAMVNAKFKAPSAKMFGELLDTVSRGLDRILTRVPNVGVTGVAVAHMLGNDRGGFMGAAPTAGMSLQQGADKSMQAISKINAEMLLAQEAGLQAEAARIASQNAARARQQGTTPTPTAPARPGTGRQAVQQARVQQQRSSTSPTAPNNAAQVANRNNALQANIRHQHEEEERHHHHDMEMQRIAREAAARRAASQAAAQKAAAQSAARQVAAKIDPNMLKGFDMKGVTGAPVSTSSADMVKQIAAQAAKTASANKLKPPTTEPTIPPVPDPNNPPYAPLYPQGKGMVR